MIATLNLAFNGSHTTSADGVVRSFVPSFLAAYQYPAPSGSPTPGATAANVIISGVVRCLTSNNYLDLYQVNMDGETHYVHHIHALMMKNLSDEAIVVLPGSPNGWTGWFYAATGPYMVLNPGGLAMFADISEPGFLVSSTNRRIEFLAPTMDGSKQVEIAAVCSGLL